MKYKPLDKVRIKSLDWYNENKDEHGNIDISHDFTFYAPRSKYCGRVFTIDVVFDNCYTVKEDNHEYYWADEMIEGLVEEETKPNIIEEAKTYWDSIKDAWICPEGYIFKDENGNIINATKIVLEKKKKEYPKTYEECCRIVNANPYVRLVYNLSDGQKYSYDEDNLRLYESIRKLLICRDAYWKIAGEEMKLGKPWEPDWKNGDEKKWVISRYRGELDFGFNIEPFRIFAFPTKEMLDAFYENFKELIEQCKELL